MSTQKIMDQKHDASTSMCLNHLRFVGSREVQVYCDMTNYGKPQVK